LKIAVCIKRVPDMELRFAIAPDGKSLVQSGLKYDMSDFDGYAVEVALQLVEKQGAGEVVLLSVGPDGVRIQPIVDTTKIAIAALTTVGAMALMLARLVRAGRE